MENIDQPKRKASVTNQRVRSPTKQQEVVTTAPNNNAADGPNNGNNNNIINCNHDYLDMFPPGYRFCPLDNELIVYYLKKKVRNEPLPPNKIMEINLYKYNPEQLAEKFKYLGENEWYFFTPRDRKYRNGSRPNRAAGNGYWKATGADKSLSFKGVIVGYRKALVFYIGKPPNGDKTNWIMHEYRVNDPPREKRGTNDMRLDDCVLCRIYKKDDKSIKTQHEDEECMPVDDSTMMFGEYENELMKMNFDDNHRIDSMEFINKYDDFQQLLQNGLPEIPQISDVSTHNFSNLDDRFRSASINYGLLANTTESMCDWAPPLLQYSTEDDYYLTNMDHCDLGPESDFHNKNNSQHK